MSLAAIEREREDDPHEGRCSVAPSGVLLAATTLRAIRAARMWTCEHPGCESTVPGPGFTLCAEHGVPVAPFVDASCPIHGGEAS